MPQQTGNRFDDIAREYDGSFSSLPGVVDLRRRIHALVLRHFPPGGTVLELGCGTGNDARMLLDAGFSVVAADRSLGMLEVAQEKLAPHCTALLQADAGALTMLRTASFHAIFSNFGALNCVTDIANSFRECHRVLLPGGAMIACLIGARPLWEICSFAVRGQLRRAVRRKTGEPVQVPLGKGSVETHYYTVRTLRSILKGLFEVHGVIGLNFISPPPSSRTFARNHPVISRFLTQAEETLQQIPGIGSLGDHIVLVLRRSGQ